MNINESNKLLISVIVPCFNSGQFIEECLQSIREQSYENWECIVVDDHSSDDTFELASNFTILDSRFKTLIRPETYPKGANSCRNYGLDSANGEFIKWFDSDDIMCVDHLKTVVETLASNDYDFVVTESQKFNVNSSNLGKPYDYNSEIPITAQNVALNRTGWITNDLTLNREALGDLRFNENLLDGHEYNLNVRMLASRLRGKIINKTLSKYRQHLTSISSQRSSDSIRNLRVQIDTKYHTARDLKRERNEELPPWFLAGFMRLSFELVLKRVRPIKLIISARMILRYFGPIKLISFFIGIFLGFTTGRGYNLVKYARNI